MEELAPITGELLNQGVLGVVVVILMFFIMKLWKAKEQRDEFIREKSIEDTVILKELTNVVDLVSNNIKELPQNVKDKIEPSLTEIKTKLTKGR